MKQQLISKINQAIQFVLLALLRLLIIIQYETRKLLRHQKVKLVLLVLSVFIAMSFVLLAPAAGSGTGGGGG